MASTTSDNFAYAVAWVIVVAGILLGGLFLSRPPLIYRPEPVIDTVISGNERYSIVRRDNFVIAAYAEPTDTGNFLLCYGTFNPRAAECKPALNHPSRIGELSWRDME